MTEIKQNFEVWAGDDKEITVIVREEDDSLLDLSGYTFNWVMYDLDDESVHLTKTLSTGLSVPTPSNGEVVITLEPDDTENLDTGLYRHELEATSSTNKISTVTVGYVIIRTSVA